MNTQNINFAPAESTETWGGGHKINGLAPSLLAGLDYLIALQKTRMMADEREELLVGTLLNMTKDICSTVTDWTVSSPVLPYSSVLAWLKAREITLMLFGENAGSVWTYACQNLKTELSAGYFMWRENIA